VALFRICVRVLKLVLFLFFLALSVYFYEVALLFAMDEGLAMVVDPFPVVMAFEVVSEFALFSYAVFLDRDVFSDFLVELCL